MRHELTLTAGPETLVLQVPTTWADVTLAEYIAWQESPEPDACALAGITPEQLNRVAWQDAGYLVNLLAFAAEVPEAHAGPGAIPPASASWGQMRLVAQYMEANPGHSDIWYAPYIWALYRCREIYGRNDEAKETGMAEAVVARPVSEVFSEVTFIWAGWLLSTNATPPPPKMLASPPETKSRPGWPSWANALGRFLPTIG